MVDVPGAQEVGAVPEGGRVVEVLEGQEVRGGPVSMRAVSAFALLRGEGD